MPVAPRAGGAFGIGVPSGATFCTCVSTNESESLPATHPVMVTTDPFIVGSGSAAPATAARPSARTTPPLASKFFIRVPPWRRRRLRETRTSRPPYPVEQDAGQGPGAYAHANPCALHSPRLPERDAPRLGLRPPGRGLSPGAPGRG